MEQVANNNGTVMAKSGGNSSSSLGLSVSIVSNLKKEFEGFGMVFTPEQEAKLTKCINKTVTENQFANLTRPLSEQSEKATFPPLVLQFDCENSGNDCVFMGMMRDGKMVVVKNKYGYESNFAQPTNEKVLVYGYHGDVRRRVGFWRPSDMNQSQPFQSVDLKELGVFDSPRLFSNARLIIKYLEADAGCNGGSVCQQAILVVPMHYKSAQRLRLKQAALFAGVQDVYLTSAEGLAAFYWFHEKKAEILKNSYSQDWVIIDLFGHPILYHMISEDDTDGKRILAVKAISLLESWGAFEDKDEILKLKLARLQMSGGIPIIRRKEVISKALNFVGEYPIKVAVVEDDEMDPCKYFPAKGAALLSTIPKNIRRRIRNMMGTMVRIDPHNVVTQAESILPETCVRGTLNFKHDRVRYRISQSRFEPGVECLNGYLVISDGIKYGTELEVTYELSWEGIWKVVGVSAKNQLDDEMPVKWSWMYGDQLDFANFDCNSYEECEALLMKVPPSPRRATGLTEDGPSADLLNTRDEAAATSVSSGTTSSEYRKEKKKRSTKSRVIRRNDIIANTGLKKIKLESDWVEPVIKTEADSMEDVGEGGNGQQVNLNEHEDCQVEEGEVKLEIIE